MIDKEIETLKRQIYTGLRRREEKRREEQRSEETRRAEKRRERRERETHTHTERNPDKPPPIKPVDLTLANSGRYSMKSPQLSQSRENTGLREEPAQTIKLSLP